MQWTKDSRVEWLRNRAEEIRRTADGMQHAESRGSLLRIAENHEEFARQRESPSGHSKIFRSAISR
jgi:hypothetical protein